MIVKAYAKSVRISPRKVSIVADAVRNMSVDAALASLAMLHKRGATILEKTLKGAVANAVNNAKLDRTSLRISTISVSPAPALKRYHPSTRGRIHPYKKRGSHITVILEGGNNGTKS